MKKRILAGLLCAVMTASLLATDTISLAAGKTDTVAATSATSPSIDQSQDTSSTSSTASDTSASDEQSSVISLGTKKVNGVSITIEAPEGVLPDGATFTVKAITGKDQDKIENTVEKELTDDETLESLQSFDITIYDQDGTEIQPDGSVNVIFKNADAADAIADPAKEVKIFHMDDSLKSAEEVTKVDTTSDALKIEADHFSVYTIAVTDNAEDVDKAASGFITGVSLVKDCGNNKYEAYATNANIAKNEVVALEFKYKIVKEESNTERMTYMFTVNGGENGLPIKDFKNAAIYHTGGNYNGQQVGTATIDISTGKVTVTFNDMAITAGDLDKGDVGTFWLGGTLDESKLGNGGNFELNWKINNADKGTSQKFTTDVIQPTNSLAVSKEANTTDEISGGIIKWTVTITPTVNNLTGKLSEYIKSIQLSDTIEASECDNTYYTDDGHKPSIQIGSTALSDVSLKNTDGVLSFESGITGTNLGESFKSGDKITVTYYTKYDTSKIGTEKKFNNTATATLTPYALVADPTSQDGVKLDTSKDGDPVTEKATTNPTISGGSVDKTKGTLVEGTKVSWTIIAKNPLKNANPTLVDQLPTGLTFGSDDKVTLVVGGTTKSIEKKDNEQTSAVTSECYYYDAKKNKIYFYLLQNTTDEQKITYTTTISSTCGSGTLTNHVDFNYDGDKPPGTTQMAYKDATVNIAGLYASKSGKYDASKHQLNWTVAMSDLATRVDNGEITITDTFDSGMKQFLVKKEGATDYTGAIKLTVGSSEFELTPTSINSDTEFSTGFILTLKAASTEAADSPMTEAQKAYTALKGVTDSSTKVELTYTTQLDGELKSIYGSNQQTGKTNNTTKIKTTDLPNGEITVSCNPDVKSSMLSKSVATAYDDASHKISWKVIVNANKMQMTSPVLTDKLDKAYWQYKEDSLKIYDITSNDDNTTALSKTSDYTVTFTQSTGEDTVSQMTIKLANDSTSKKYKITYDTYLPDDFLNVLNTNDSVTVTNTVNLTASEVMQGLSEQGKFTVKSGVLSKVFESGATSFDANWIITVNSNFAAVTNKDDTAITISDTIDSALMFPNVDAAIEVVQYKKTAATTPVTLTKGTDYSWTYNENTRELRVTFMNSEKVDSANKLTDKYVITVKTVVSSSGTYTNTVNMEGTDNGSNISKTGTSNLIQLSGGYTGGSFSNLFATIQLTKKNLSGTVLTGATYEVYKADKTTKVGEITTGSDSKRNVLTVSAGTNGAGATYYLKEMTAPSGYQKSEDWIQADVKGGETTEVVALDIAEGVKTATYKISKQSLGQGLELVGATLTISTDDAGKNVITSWTSDGTTHEVTLADGNYYLTEKAVPYGYTEADQICFTVAKGTDGIGKITSVTKGGSVKDNVSGNMLIMKDSVKTESGTTTVKISKQAAGQGTELKGAKLTVTAVKNGTTETIDSWTSDGSAREISDIAYQVAYTLTEDQAPTGYDIAESITFKLVKEGDGDVIYILNTSTGVWEKSDKSSVIMEDRRTGTSGGNNGGGSGNSGGSSDDPEDSMATPTPALKPSASPSPAAAAAGDDNGVNGANLPKTGGFIGTVTAYGVGIALILAGCYLFFKKKKVTGHDKRRED